MNRMSHPFLPRAASVILAALACIAARPGQAEDTSAILRDGLQSCLTGHRQSGVALSAHVVDLSTGKTVFEFDADKPMVPASVMKLVVASAALDQLGPAHRFRTLLAVGAKDLLVVGGGDPTLGDDKLCAKRGQKTTALLETWADALVKAGVRRIPGNLIIDDSIFDETFVHTGWPEDQYQEWYEAPVGGLNFADNCVEVAVDPGKNGTTSLRLLPPNGLMKLINKSRSGPKASLVAHRSRDAAEIVVSGVCSGPARLGPIAVNDPGLFFAASLESALAARGIIVDGTIVRRRVADRSGKLPSEFRVIAVHESPLADAIARACTDSLGMMSECVLKTLGAASGQAGSWPNGAAAVARFLRKLGVTDDAFVIDDGSGLSRRNRLSARSVTTVLAYMNHTASGELLFDSLAESGVSGTLKRRLATPDAKGRIHAKTGYIASVRTLAGYVETRDHRRFAFAFLYNGGAKGTAPLTQAQDKACRLMANWPTAASAPAPSPRPRKK